MQLCSGTSFLYGKRVPERRIIGVNSKNLAQGEKGLLCSNCSHLNPSGLEESEYCNSHLFVKCNKCKVRVQRGIVRCPKCHQWLRNRPFLKFKRRLFCRSRKITLGQAALISIVAYGMYKVFAIVSAMRKHYRQRGTPSSWHRSK